MISDAQAVQFANRAIKNRIGAGNPTDGEVAVLFAVSLAETGFGYYWKGAGVGSFNQGAIQCGPWSGDKFYYTDTHPNDDGTSTPYRACFRKYPTEQAGWDNLVDVLYTGKRTGVHDAAVRNDWTAVSTEMYRTVYYQGYGKTPADRIANHKRAMARGINRALAVLGAGPIVIPPPGSVVLARVLKRGCIGDDVKRAQLELRLAADGIFGRITEAATIQYQIKNGLKGDGRIGDLTWTKLMTDDYNPIAA